MLRNTKTLEGLRLNARDGEIGKVKDFYFDDLNWAVRHLVADTGTWLPQKQVLISPFAVLAVREGDKCIDVNLSKKQIEDSPPIESDKPVSLQEEERYYQHYGWPFYWEGPLMWGPYGYPQSVPATPVYRPPEDLPEPPRGDPHLRGVNAVRGYHIQALDKEFGHIESFIIGEDDWAIRHVVIDTKNWWPGKRVLLPREWISSVDWDRSQIHVELNRDTVKRAPEYDPTQPISREYEERLYRFYDREPYWSHEPAHAR